MRREQFALPLIRLLVKRPRLGNAVFRFDRWGNIFGPDRFVDPYPIYERMRAAGPVSFSPLYQQWAILGYDEAQAVLTSNSFGVESQLEIFLSTRPYSKFSDHTKTLIRNVLLFTDPPKHTRLRSLVNRAFTSRQMDRLEPRVDKLAHELIADMADDACPDVVANFAPPLPINVISDLLGVPEERWEWAAQMSGFIRDVLDPLATIDPVVVDAAFDEITDYYSGLANQRLAEPKNDLITGLVHAEEQGDRLSRDELVSFVTLLMFAGHETTSGTIGNSIVALANHPDQRALVRANPDLWPSAVEELPLRHRPAHRSAHCAGRHRDRK